jgi:hypothetical protein
VIRDHYFIASGLSFLTTSVVDDCIITPLECLISRPTSPVARQATRSGGSRPVKKASRFSRVPRVTKTTGFTGKLLSIPLFVCLGLGNHEGHESLNVSVESIGFALFQFFNLWQHLLQDLFIVDDLNGVVHGG